MNRHGRPIAWTALLAAVLVTAGCAGATHTTKPPAGAADSTSADPAAPIGADSKPVPVATLRGIALTAADLGPDYTQHPSEPSGKGGDDVSMPQCPELAKLNTLNTEFASSTEVTFTDDSNNSQLTEDLGSDSPSRLTSVIGGAFQAMISCPSFTMTSGSTPISVTTSKVTPTKLGDEQWGAMITMAGPASTTVVEDIAIRSGNTVLGLVGAPGLVENHVLAAFTKFHQHRA